MKKVLVFQLSLVAVTELEGLSLKKTKKEKRERELKENCTQSGILLKPDLAPIKLSFSSSATNRIAEQMHVPVVCYPCLWLFPFPLSTHTRLYCDFLPFVFSFLSLFCCFSLHFCALWTDRSLSPEVIAETLQNLHFGLERGKPLELLMTFFLNSRFDL